MQQNADTDTLIQIENLFFSDADVQLVNLVNTLTELTATQFGVYA